MSDRRRPDGFPGQKLLILPGTLARQIPAWPPLADLYPTDVGWFPRARDHFRSRPRGAPQGILIYCLAGRGFVERDGRTAVGPDQAFFVPAGRPHSYGADAADPWSIHWVHFQGTSAPAWSNAGPGPLTIDPEHRPLVCGLFEELEGTFDHGFQMSDLIRGAGILGHLLALVRFPPPGHPSSLDPVDETLRFMAAHLELRSTLGELAARAGYSVSHFVTLFQKATGAPPLEFWQRLRIREACRRLDEGTAIAEVSRGLGFDDPLYFSRVFRKARGESPRSYKNRERG